MFAPKAFYKQLAPINMTDFSTNEPLATIEKVS